MLLVISRIKLTEAGQGLVQSVVAVFGDVFLLHLLHDGAYPA